VDPNVFKRVPRQLSFGSPIPGRYITRIIRLYNNRPYGCEFKISLNPPVPVVAVYPETGYIRGEQTVCIEYRPVVFATLSTKLIVDIAESRSMEVLLVGSCKPYEAESDSFLRRDRDIRPNTIDSTSPGKDIIDETVRGEAMTSCANLEGYWLDVFRRAATAILQRNRLLRILKLLCS
jgi:hypothetical protein